MKMSILVSYLNSSGPANVNDDGKYGLGAEGMIVVDSINVSHNCVTCHSDARTRCKEQDHVLVTTMYFLGKSLPI